MSEAHLLAGRLLHFRDLTHQWLVRRNVAHQERVSAQIAECAERISSRQLGRKRRKKAKERLNELRRIHAYWRRPDTAATSQYVDLMFSFGLARLGATEASADLLEQAGRTLPANEPVHDFLFRAFRYRIRQAQGGAAADSLSPELTGQLEGMEDRFARYKIDRMRESSKILEPGGKVDPYKKWFQRGAMPEGLMDLDALFEETKRKDKLIGLAEFLRRMAINDSASSDMAKILDFVESLPPPDDLRQLLRTHDQDPRNDEDYEKMKSDSQAMVEEYIELYELQAHARLIREGIEKARAAGNVDLVDRFLNVLLRLLKSQKGANPWNSFGGFIDMGVAALRELSGPLHVSRFLHASSEILHQGEDPPSLKVRSEPYWLPVLRLLQETAAGWISLGELEPAIPILDASLDFLTRIVDAQSFGNVELAVGHINALKLAQQNFALGRLESLLRGIAGIYDTFSTSPHYSLAHLRVVDTLVLTVLDLAADADEPLTVCAK